MNLPRVLILYTGGTIGMDIRADSKSGTTILAIPHLSAESLKDRLYLRAPELKEIADCDVDILMNRDSSHIGPDEWLSMANHIRSKWKNYDGIVLLHGTDTLAYSASALSMLLRPCLKPVVLTGAQRPLSAMRTDARMNLISAVEIAATGPRKLVKQVCVFFDDQLFQGNRVRKRSAADFDAFESPHFPSLAVVGTTIRYRDDLPKITAKKELPLKSVFSRKVLTAHVTPGFPAHSLSDAFLSELDGLVLVVFLSATAPTHDPLFIDFLTRARKKELPVVIVTEGSTQPPSTALSTVNYEAGKELLARGCFWGGSMTLECAYVKTSLILSQTRGLKEFTRMWKQDLAGEGA